MSLNVVEYRIFSLFFTFIFLIMVRVIIPATDVAVRIYNTATQENSISLKRNFLISNRPRLVKSDWLTHGGY